MTVADFIVFPIYFAFFTFLAKSYAKKNVDESIRKHFMYGFYIKCFSSFATGLIYWFYYGGGDTIYYFLRMNFIHTMLGEDFPIGMKLLFGNPHNYDAEVDYFYKIIHAHDGAGLLLVRMGWWLSLFSFKLYSVIALFFSLFSFSGIWKLYLLFIDKYPHIPKKHLAITCLYLPSVFFWGSGLFKDTVTFGCMCWTVVIVNDFFAKRKFGVFKLIFLVLNIIVIGVIKSYILLALMPAFLVWGYKSVKAQIKSKFLSALSTPILIAAVGVFGFFILNQLSSIFTKFALDNIQTRAEGMQRWHTVRGDQKEESSTYSLGHISFTPAGILKKIPAAINVTLFRPYIWESHNPVMLMASIESQFFLLIFIRFGLFRLFALFRLVSKDPFLTFSVVFSLIFSFSVGFTSFNFGALVRYKVPLLPFFALFLALLYNDAKGRKKEEKLDVLEE